MWLIVILIIVIVVIVAIVVIVIRIIGNGKRDHRLKEGTRFRGIAVIHRHLFKLGSPYTNLLTCSNKLFMTKGLHSSFGETLPK